MDRLFWLTFAILSVIFIPTVAFAAPVIVPAILGAGASALATAIVSVAVNVAISYVVSKIFQPRGASPQAPDISDPGVKQRIPSDTANKLPVIYGQQRVRGSIIYADISSNNQRMAFIITLGEGPVQGIRGVRWDDNNITFSGVGFNTNLNAGQRYGVARTNSNFGSGSNETNFLNGNFFCAVYPNGGRCTQMESFSTRWRNNAANRTMPNTAYAFVELRYNRDDNVTGLTNDLSFLVEGRTVRSVQSGGTLAASPAYSTNPADCLVDYMTNTRYGCSVPLNSIDLDSMFAWSDFCDDQISGASRYTCNGTVNTNDAADTTISDMTVSAGGALTYSLGQFGIVIDRTWDETRDGAIAVLDDTNIYGDVNIRNTGFQEIINRLTVRYNERNNHEYEEQIILNTPDSRRNQSEPLLDRTIRAQFADTRVQATRLGAIALNKSRNTQTVEVYTDLSFSNTVAGDVIRFSYSPYNISNQLYRVLSIEENRIRSNDANGQSYDSPGLKLSLQRYSDSDYVDQQISEYVTAPNTSFPNARLGVAVSDLTIVNDTPEASVPYFDLRWTVPGGGFIEAFRVYHSTTGTFSTALTSLL